MYTLENYLAMDLNNPILKRDKQVIERMLLRMLQNGEITYEQQQDYLEQFALKNIQLRRYLHGAFSWYSRLSTVGVDLVKFKREELEALLVARRASVEFYNWVNTVTLTRNNPHITGYINQLCRSLLESIQKGEEARWSHYTTLRSVSLFCISHNLVSRDKLSVAAKLIQFMVKQEFELLDDKKESTELSASTSFGATSVDGGSAAYKPFVEMELATEMIFLLLTDPTAYNLKVDAVTKQLLKDKQEGRLSADSYSYYKNFLLDNSTYLISSAEVYPYDPIIAYWVFREDKVDGPQYCFNTKQISEAALYAFQMYQNLPNSFLVEQIIHPILKINLDHLGDLENSKKELMRKLETYCDMFLAFGLISTSDMLSYITMGREKFNG